ncbi:hypothetical protein CHS0354_040799 [Potamilus streckersoni]|uniref:Proline-rich transmembrane protein 1-like n=1 Tax=Potamilus streckersoni TaxID=2493646 RepID=A0AAE0SM23_9BIVA|nr:hypothetical protein CHS0354_040799 [Potamilus streckersoni]
MSDEKAGMLSGQDQSGPPPYHQTVVGYSYEQGSAGPPQSFQIPSQQVGQYPMPQVGYYPPPQAGQYPQQGYYPQHVQTFVVAPQQQTMINQPAPQDYMNRAIFATLCCFWPTGICAIMKASDARQALARGDIAGAHSSAQSARQFVNISIIAGVLSIVVACVIIGIYVGIVVNSFTNND